MKNIVAPIFLRHAPMILFGERMFPTSASLFDLGAPIIMLGASMFFMGASLQTGGYWLLAEGRSSANSNYYSIAIANGILGVQLFSGSDKPRLQNREYRHHIGVARLVQTFN